MCFQCKQSILFSSTYQRWTDGQKAKSAERTLHVLCGGEVQELFVSGAEEEISFLLIFFAKFKLIRPIFNYFCWVLLSYFEYAFTDAAFLTFHMFKGLFLHLLYQGFPTFLWQCTPSAFRQMSIYHFSISKDKNVPLQHFDRWTCTLKFLMTKYFIMINHRYI